MTSLVNILRQADIFYNLSSAQLDMIAGICQQASFEAEEVIVSEGTASDELYIIIQGEVEILVNPSLVTSLPDESMEPVTIAALRRGQSFGEIALVDRGVRSATVKATQKNTRVLIIPRQKLMDLCDHQPELGYFLMKNLAADLALKMRTTGLRVRQALLSSTNHAY